MGLTHCGRELKIAKFLHEDQGCKASMTIYLCGKMKLTNVACFGVQKIRSKEISDSIVFRHSEAILV